MFLFLCLGNCASSEKSIVTLLKRSECTACILVVGGASEALNAYPGGYRITLNRRKGFIRVALQTGYVAYSYCNFVLRDVHGLEKADYTIHTPSSSYPPPTHSINVWYSVNFFLINRFIWTQKISEWDWSARSDNFFALFWRGQKKPVCSVTTRP